MKGLTALQLFEQLNGTIHHLYPPIPIRTEDCQATHPLITDEETGGELYIGHGRTPEEAARDGLATLLDYLIEQEYDAKERTASVHPGLVADGRDC